MQNSLERLFDGMATALREDVLPNVADPYGRAQVLATIELLGNVAARVEWSCAGLRDEIERIRAVLAAASSPPAILSQAVPEGNAALVESRRQHLDELARLQESAGDSVQEPLRAFLRWHLARELALLRTGMYKS